MKNIFCSIVSLTKIYLFILSVFFLSLSGTVHSSTEISTFIQPFQFNASPELVHTLRAAGVTTVSFPVVWAHVEKEQGKYDFSLYDKYLDSLVRNGINVVIIIDSSGRFQFDYKTGKLNREGKISIPGWMSKIYPDLMSSNFYGEKVPEIDFYNKKTAGSIYSFYEEATNYFQSKYGNKIAGFAIGIQSEFELKYGQTGYAWRNYSNSAKKEFSTWLDRKDMLALNSNNNIGNGEMYDEASFSFCKKFREYILVDYICKFNADVDGVSSSRDKRNDMPIINYNNNIGKGKATVEPNFSSFMSFREFFLAKHICSLAAIIRGNGGRANGYFGEVFTSHDAIYATGVIEEVVSCLDAVTIDYNFYDGYRRVSNPWIPAMLSNYAKNLGFKKVFTGYYIERWRKKDGENEVVENEILKVISESLEILDKDKMSDGVEIGGFPIRLSEISKLKTIDFSILNSESDKSPYKYSIGILAAKSNYYLWHGERSFQRNIHSDALVESYKLFLQDGEFKVYVLGEETIVNRPDIMSSLDAVYIPHQTTIAPHAEHMLLKYNQSGLKLIQDIRFSTFDPDGRFQGDWQSELFGISIIDWKNDNEVFTYRGGEFTIDKQSALYASHAVLYPLDGYNLIAASKTDVGGGLMLKGKSTLVLGFMPQLLEGDNADVLKKIAVNEIKRLINVAD